MQPEATPTLDSNDAAKNFTKKPSGADASASGSLGVAAVTVSLPGLPKPKAKPVPKASAASNFMLTASMLGNFGAGSSLGLGLGSVKADDMMTGLVDFDLKGRLPLGLLGSTCSHGNLLNALVGLPATPLETFALDGPTVSRRVTLKKVEDLNLSINTEFHDVYLQEQLASPVWQDTEPWILFESGAAAHCCLTTDWTRTTT